MLVVGPTGRRVRLPCADGLTYPGHGTAVDEDGVRCHAPHGRVRCRGHTLRRAGTGASGREGTDRRLQLSTGETVDADFVIGADGATSEVAAAAGLVDPRLVLWGFAVRTYLPQVVDLPAIVLWEPTPWRAFPGYGWVFPGEQGGANVGLGIGTRSDRKAGAQAVRALPEFLAHLRALGLLENRLRRCRHAVSVAGSRWGWSGLRRRGGGSFWSAMRQVS